MRTFYASLPSNASRSICTASFSCDDIICGGIYPYGMATIHDKIKAHRERLELSMMQFAEAVGVKAWQTIQQWENGRADFFILRCWFFLHC